MFHFLLLFKLFLIEITWCTRTPFVVVNPNADGLNQNPSSNGDDTIRTCWHGDVDLEVVPRWHAFAYLCILLECYGDIPHTNVNDGDPHDVDMELKGNGALDIYDDAPVIAYLQEGKVPIHYNERCPCTPSDFTGF
jgi:hypothetical protein